MPCYSPLSAWQLESGDIVFSERGRVRRALNLPCGSCIGCRLEKARQWAVRCMHEAQMHQENWFVTLTYDEAHLPNPPGLRYRDFQLFVKRLRKKRAFRFFMCGEYGERNARPHFHACMFGLSLSDLILFKESEAVRLYTSEVITEAWQNGFASVGAVTYESANYVARYALKGFNGTQVHVDRETGEVLPREFLRMSLKPGIGYSWIERYTDDVFNYDHVVVSGRKGKVPRYYDKFLKERDPLRLESLEPGRYLRACQAGEDSSPARLAAKAAVARARLSLKKRSL